MKYIVIGLGRFGSRLASNLMDMGHEVIGIDHDSEKLEELKESFTTVMKMDTTNLNAVKSLPMDDVDAVIVAIGKDIGSSILTMAILKNLNVKRIIGRAINQIHYDILKQIGIEEVILPLEEAALHVSSMLQFRNILKLTEINHDFVIVEVNIPSKYAGHCLDAINIEKRFDLKLIAVKIPPEKNILSSIFRRNYKVFPDYDVNKPLNENDILVIAGKIADIKRFIES
ncbi:MAG TPA: TrkA family potassium uptake protein [Bacteroidales bacterium]|nr:potassium transporter TrkA [Bacteroidales bacterium]HOU96233.1 TrkA family potassium uptake protein [Bacteroidales bacterium]HQG36951.1 TrkA family potassium uptake protein [Bacteroidales bacterium]HQG52032.1 TrkA family potassium uptake protein [Bacteroidales bacterium]HQJ21213.1 TrkA family potassium uptake protein [Bacteroidales bacterium]